MHSVELNDLLTIEILAKQEFQTCLAKQAGFFWR